MNCYFLTRSCCCLIRSSNICGHYRLQQHLPIRWNESSPASKAPPPPQLPAPKKTSKPLEAKIDVKIKEIISSMSKTERQMMYDQLRMIIYDEKPNKVMPPEEPKTNVWSKFLKKSSDSIKKYIDKPTMSQLTKLFLFHSLPYVAFGFMDNSIMLLCGDYIHVTIGEKLSMVHFLFF